MKPDYIPDLPYPSHHWIIPHHFTKLHPDVAVEAIRIFPKYDGQSLRATRHKGQHIISPTRIAINEEMARFLTVNERSDLDGRSEPFRDYQQLFLHLGIFYPHKLVGQTLRVAPLFQALAGGTNTLAALDLAPFMLLQAMGYQFPNGASDSKTITPYLAHGVTVKPFLMIYQVLTALTRLTGEPSWLFQDEIVTFLVPQRNHDQIERIANAILSLRNEPLQFGSNPIRLPYRYETDTDHLFDERRRTVAEVLHLMQALPLFEVFYIDGKTALPYLPSAVKKSNNRPRGRRAVRFNPKEYEKLGVQDVQALAILESRPDAFFLFQNTSDASRLAWFDYYTSPARLARWQAEVIDQQRITERPRIKLRELPVEFEPLSTIAPATLLSSPEETAELHIQRRNAHQETLYRLAGYIREAGGDPSYDPQSVDMEVFLNKTRYIFEIKSLAVDQHDTLPQIREAIGQLLEYRYRFGDSDAVIVIVLNRFPSEEPWIIPFLEAVEITICWWDEKAQKFGCPEFCADLLSFLPMTEI